MFAPNFLRQATQIFSHIASTKMEDAMVNARSTTLATPVIDQAMNETMTKGDTSEVTVVDAAARQQELERASRSQSGVLRELALARWRGSAT